MTTDDLVERARLAIAAEWGCAQPCQSQPECTCARDARLAVNMALEEAAKVADRVADEAAVHCREALLDDARAIADQCADEYAGAYKAAAAIRALVKEPTPGSQF